MRGSSGSPGAPEGVHTRASSSGVAVAIVWLTASMCSRRTARSCARSGLARTSSPRDPGSASQDPASPHGWYGCASPRIIRPCQRSVARIRCRSVSRKLHSPSTRSVSRAGASAEARPTVARHRASIVAHPAVSPTGSVARSSSRSGNWRSSSASTSGATSTPFTRRPPMYPERSASRNHPSVIRAPSKLGPCRWARVKSASSSRLPAAAIGWGPTGPVTRRPPPGPDVRPPGRRTPPARARP